MERRVDADLESGRGSELIGELETLIAEHPLREKLRGQLILALYRAGRQAEALEVYREARRTLDEELGLEPGPALRELEKAILRQDPSLVVPPPPLPPFRRLPPRVLPADACSRACSRSSWSSLPASQRVEVSAAFDNFVVTGPDAVCPAGAEPRGG